MHVGLRAPTNLFGHPTDDILVQLDEELQRWDNLSIPDPVTKIVYGHYPMSFTTSTETGKRPEDIMARNGVAAYICGHLHTTFGRRLYKHHKYAFLLEKINIVYYLLLFANSAFLFADHGEKAFVLIYP